VIRIPTGELYRANQRQDDHDDPGAAREVGKAKYSKFGDDHHGEGQSLDCSNDVVDMNEFGCAPVFTSYLFSRILHGEGAADHYGGENNYQ
jgi:hypothetical protein